MSELIDQIAKLEAKAHALKESVSPLNIQSSIILFRGNTWKPWKSSTSCLKSKRSCMETRTSQSKNQAKRLPSFAISFPWASCRKVSYDFKIYSIFLENFNVALELLRKAETLTEEGDKYRAVTYNNFACIFRRTKKLRSALNYLEKALEIEYNYLHYSD